MVTAMRMIIPVEQPAIHTPLTLLYDTYGAQIASLIILDLTLRRYVHYQQTGRVVSMIIAKMDVEDVERIARIISETFGGIARGIQQE